MKHHWKPLCLLAIVLGAVVALAADYDSNYLGDIDTARPAQAEDPKLAAAQSIRETRRAAKNSFMAQHQSNGTHSNNFLTSAMIQNGAVTVDKLATGSVTAIKIGEGALAGVTLGTNEFQKAESGFVKLQGGLILQWTSGTNQTAEGSQTVALPMTFPTACLSVQVTCNNEANSYADFWYQLVSKTSSNVTVFKQNSAGGVAAAPVIFAIGY